VDQSGDPATAALISAARELFTERGYAGVRTEEIVVRAGVTRGALYQHFRGGKEDLFRAVLVGLTGEIAGRVRTAAQRREDPWDALVAGLDVFLDACAAPGMRQIILVDGPLVLGWDVWRAIDEHYAHRLIEAALQRAIDAGQLAPQPTDALAHVLLGALYEAANVIASAEDPAQARDEMGRRVHRLLEGIRATRV
jgi:AcrR family transcriptional regulator